MPSEAQIIEEMSKLGLDPAEWQYDPRLHGYRRRGEVEAERQTQAVAKQPLAEAEPVESPSLVARAGAAVGKAWNAANAPFVHLPRLPKLTEEDPEYFPGQRTISNVASGALNTLAGVGESLTSPVGLVTLPFVSARVIAKAPRVAQGVGAALQGMGLHGAFESARELTKDIMSKEGVDAQTATERALGTVLGGAAVLGGKHISEAGTQVRMDNFKKATAAEEARIAAEVEKMRVEAAEKKAKTNTIEAGEPTSEVAQAVALRNLRDPAKPKEDSAFGADKPADVSAPEFGKVTNKDIKRQTRIYEEAFDRLAQQEFVDENGRQIVDDKGEPLGRDHLVMKAVSGDAKAIEAVDRIEKQLRDMGLEPQNTVEPLAPPDLILGEPVAAVKKPAKATPPIAAPNLPRLGELTPEGFEVIDTADWLRKKQAAEATRGAPRRMLSDRPEDVQVRPGTGPGEFFEGSDLPRLDRVALSRLRRAKYVGEESPKPAAPARTPTGPGNFFEGSDLPRVDSLAKATPGEMMDLPRLEEAPKAAKAPIKSTLTKQIEAAESAIKEQQQRMRDYKAAGKPAVGLTNMRRKAWALQAELDALLAEKATLAKEAAATGGKGGLKIKPSGKGGEAGFFNVKAVVDEIMRTGKALGAKAARSLGDLQAQIPRLAALSPDVAKHVAAKFDQMLETRREFGRYANEFRGAVNDASWDAVNAAYEAALQDKAARNYNASNALRISNPEAFNTLTRWRKTLADMADNQIAAGQPVLDNGVPRTRGKDPFYFPEVISRDVIREIRNDVGQQGPLAQDFLNYHQQRGLSLAEARELLNDIVKNYSSHGEAFVAENAKSLKSFGAVRRAESFGLPKSWREINPDRALERYANNFARDRAMYDAIEKSPDTMHMLGMREDFYGRPVNPTNPHLPNVGTHELVENILNDYMNVGGSYTRSPVLRGLMQMTSSALIGLKSKASDAAGVLTGAKFMPEPVLHLPGYLGNLMRLDKTWKAYQSALEQGVARPTLKTSHIVRHLAASVFRHGETFSEGLSDLSTALQNVTLQQHAELIIRAVSKQASDYIVNVNAEYARAGHPEAQSFMDTTFGPGRWQKMTPDQLAARTVELMQGTMDARNLPRVHTNLKPVLQFKSWAMEMTYNWKKYELDPALRGNIQPMLVSSGMALAGAALVNGLFESLTGSPQDVPSMKEIESATPDQRKVMAGYKAISAAAMFGQGGLISSMIKGLADSYVMGLSSRGLTPPVLDVAAQNLDRTKSMTKALIEGEPAEAVIPQYLSDMAASNVQTLRILEQVASKFAGIELPGSSQADMDRRNAYRDQRMYRFSQGLPLASVQIPHANYEALSVQKFKRTGSVEDAANMLPRLLERAERKSNDDPTELQRQFRNLRTMPQHQFPDPDKNPIEFGKYYDWLVKTKGHAAADAAVAQYLEQREVNRVKQDMVPTLNL